MAKNYIDHLVRDGVNYPFLDRSKNLLNNPFFTVNQRGGTTWTESAGTNTYCVDRWKFVRGTVKKLSNGVNGVNFIAQSENYNRFLQIVDYTPALGETLTATMKCKVNSLTRGDNDGVRFAIGLGGNLTNVPNSWKQITETGEQELSFTFTATSAIAGKNNLAISVYVKPDSSVNIDIYAMKLERGAVSTLQYDYPENNEIELIKCATSTIEPADTYANKHLVFESN